MGSFDTVLFMCPNCRADVNVQSKEGECRNQTFKHQQVPTAITLSIQDTTVQCDECKSLLLIESYSVPNTVYMQVIPYKAPPSG